MNKELGLIVLTLLAGCSTSGSSLDATTPAAFCRAAAEEQCGRMYSCLTDNEKRALSLPATEEECAREFESDCERGPADCGTANAFAPEAAAQCLDQMQAAACNDAREAWLDAPACENVCERTGGAFEVGWRFTGSYICADVSATTVAVVAEAAGTRFVTKFSCDDYHGITNTVPYGEYNVFLELFDQYDRKLYTGLGVRGRLDAAQVDLGTLTIPVGN